MKKYKPYPSYRNSNIAWLGDIPAHWRVTRLQNLFKEQDGRSISGDEDLLSVSHYTGVTKRKEKFNSGELITNAKSLVGYKIVNPGDLVMNIMLAWNGSLGVSKYYGITSPAYAVFKPCNINEKYFDYLLRTKNAQQEFKKHSTGIIDSRLRLYPDKFIKIQCVLPPHEEQTAIARFLDYKLAKINRFIRKKKQLIKLLNEQKAAIINQAVTKGLDPHASMKDSGIEWLGEIPAHWEVRKLKYVAKVKTGKTPKIESSSSDYFSDGNINWFTPGDFKENGILSESNRKINNQAVKDGQVSIFPENTVYLIGIGGTIGKVGISFKESSCNQQINTILFSKVVSSLYAFYYLKSQKHQIDLLADFTTLPILNQAKNKEIIISLPPIEEQKAIVSYIEQETATLNKAISTIEKEIALVEEYKTALIAEAVMGKIDVRAYPIPEAESEEEEELEDELSLVAEEAEEYETPETE